MNNILKLFCTGGIGLVSTVLCGDNSTSLHQHLFSRFPIQKHSLSIDSPGRPDDTAHEVVITRRIVIRDRSDDPAAAIKPPANLIQNSFLNLGFARVSPENSGPNALPELATLNSNHIGISNEYGLNLMNNQLRFWFGIKYDIMNYRFSNESVRLVVRNSEFLTRNDSGVATSKSKVVVNYLGIPLSISYNSDSKNPENGISVRAGVVAGYRVRTHSKVKLENGRKEKEFDDYNFNDFLFTPFIEATYNNFGFYVRMNTTPVFKSGQGLVSNGIQFGIVMM